MNGTIETRIIDLPGSLIQKVNTHIRLFAITMLIANNIDEPEKSCSGTLCSIKKYKGILTAKHVWEDIKKHKYLFIMLGDVPFIIEVDLLVAITPKGQFNHIKIPTNIPDISFIKLPIPCINQIESKNKVFFSVDNRIDSESLEYIKNNIGYYALFGAPMELVEHENKVVPSFIYNTYRSDYFEFKSWDYQFFNLNIDLNPSIPKNYEGVSGGGIWKVKFWMDEGKADYGIDNLSKNVALAGVNFYQTEMERRQIIGHGPDSIYRTLYNLIL